MEDERDDEDAEVERDYQDREEEQDDEAEDTESVMTYVNSTIPSMIMMKEIPMPIPHRKVTYNYALYFCLMSC